MSTEIKTYEIVKTKFEQAHFKILNPLLFAEIRDNGTLILRNKTEFTNVYENCLFEKVYFDCEGKKIKKHSLVKDWLKDQTMRTYDSIDFLPMQQTPEKVYNTFKNYAGANLPQTKLKDITKTKIYEHIQNLCNNNKDVVDYFIKFLARKLQQPYKLTNTCLIFRSSEGCGKDTFFNWFGNSILGRNYYLNEDKIQLIFGRFNSCIENKILVIVNETSGRDTTEMMSSIKNAITRNVNSIEIKGLSAYDNTNNIGYICLTNNKNSMRIDAEDRRFCAIECNNSIANNHEYFTALHVEMEDPNITRAFYDYFMSINVSNYDFTANRPITEFHNSMKEISVPILVRFLENETNHSLINNIKIRKYSRLYEHFTTFLSQSQIKYDISEAKFGRDLKEFSSITKKRTNKGIIYCVDFTTLQQYLIEKYKIENYTTLELTEMNEISTRDLDL
jgi:Family of unknown function (DUF5906)